MRLERRPGDQQIVAAGDDSFSNRRDLGRRLPQAEDYLGKALADAAVMIDPRVAEVFKRRLAQNLKEPLLSCLRRKGTSLHVIEEGAELEAIHGSKYLALVDFASSRAIT